MRWQIKALVQSLLSIVPMGEQVQHVLQRKMTRSVPMRDPDFLDYARSACVHIEKVVPHLGVALPSAVFYEFGAGYELAGPLTFSALGVGRQMLVDVRALVRADLVCHTLRQLEAFGERLSLPRLPRSAQVRQRTLRADLLRDFGVRYIAPCDARATGIPTGSIDCITSTRTMQHIPRDDIRAILLECRRILKHDGVMSLMINYQDHYAYSDASISVYNFFKFSDAVWSLVNPSLHFQNRLRHRDYLALFRDAGFDVVEQIKAEPSDPDVVAIRKLRLARRFVAYSVSELATPGAHILLRKAPAPS